MENYMQFFDQIPTSGAMLLSNALYGSKFQTPAKP